MKIQCVNVYKYHHAYPGEAFQTDRGGGGGGIFKPLEEYTPLVGVSEILY